MDFTNMTNASILEKMKKYENEYEAVKNNLNHLLDKLQELDKKYIHCKDELIRRGYRI